jgi:hypothetical protein
MMAETPPDGKIFRPPRGAPAVAPAAPQTGRVHACVIACAPGRGFHVGDVNAADHLLRRHRQCENGRDARAGTPTKRARHASASRNFDMTSVRPWSLMMVRAIFGAAAVLGGASARGQTLATLHKLTGADGAAPAARLIAGPGGVLYGVTPRGGAINCGMIFALTPPAAAGANWAFAQLYDFPDAQAACAPVGPLVRGAGGQLYGAAGGGASNGGVVFELAPPATAGAAWQFQTLHAFTSQGVGTTPPDGGPVIDANGVLYGTLGGSIAGAVYSLTPPAKKGGTWTEALLFSAGGYQSSNPAPFGSLLLHTGGLYGIACPGSGQTCNLVSLSPPAGGTGTWTLSVLLALPYGSTDVNTDLVADSSGDLFGTSPLGGSGNAGDVFELSPPASAGESWTYKELFAFASSFASGGEPTAGVTFDAHGALWGVASTAGTATSVGLVYSLTPPTGQGSWTYHAAYSFSGGADGGGPAGGLVLGADGGLYGTTQTGGGAQDQLFPTSGYSRFGYGTIFGWTP